MIRIILCLIFIVCLVVACSNDEDTNELLDSAIDDATLDIGITDINNIDTGEKDVEVNTDAEISLDAEIQELDANVVTDTTQE